MNIRYRKLRFNLDKARDREAWELLQSVPGSGNAYVLDAICAYAKQRTREEADAVFRQQTLDLIRSELRSQTVVPQTEPRKAQAVDDAVLDNFLESFS